MSKPDAAETGDCFLCVGHADSTYRLVFDSGKTVEDKLMCGECVDAFQDLDWIEVSESRVLFRGGTGDIPDRWDSP